MTIRKLPEIKAFARPNALAFEAPPGAVSRWDASLRAAADNGPATIDIYDVIGEDFWTGGGITAKSISRALQGAADVTVNVNSPGGDFFEGIAIYNVLRAHAGKVTIKIMGLAASAASIIAMAGDTTQIARAGFLMIHNAWSLAIGDRHDMADASEFLAPFDAAMAEVYAARTGKRVADIAAMLDDETWINGDDAVAQGFADALLPADQVKEDAKAKAQGKSVSALRQIDAVLAQAGRTRSERRGLIKELRGASASHIGTSSAAEDEPMSGAGLSDIAASLRQLRTSIRP